MAYRRGDPPINFSLGFRILSHVVFLAVLAAVTVVSLLVYHGRVRGRRKLRRSRPALLLSNHTLFLDPGLLAMAVTPFRTYFTMLEETALIPALGTFVRLLGAVPIPEDLQGFRRLERSLRQALARGSFVHFFPEGECFQWSQELQPFHPGVFLLACRLGVPAIPIVTVLHGRRWGGRHYLEVLGRRLYLPPRVRILIGDPVHPRAFAGPAGKTHAAGGSVRRAAAAMQASVRAAMQRVIDRQGGSKTIFRGQMARIAGQAAHRGRGRPAGGLDQRRHL